MADVLIELMAMSERASKQRDELAKALDHINMHAVEVDGNMMIPKVEWDAVMPGVRSVVGGSRNG